MATEGTFNGTLMQVLTSSDGTSWVELNHFISASFSLSHSPRSTTSNQSGGWETKAEGMRSGSLSGEALYAEDATNGYTQLRTLLKNRTLTYVRYTSDVSGDKYEQGQGYFTQVEKSNGGPEETMTYSFEFEFSGEPTQGTIS